VPSSPRDKAAPDKAAAAATANNKTEFASFKLNTFALHLDLPNFSIEVFLCLPEIKL
jgi:hypothetical protein